jgi:putative ABC transport system permease protein
MAALVDQALGRPRFNAVLLNLFAAVALLLAGVGIYGVMAHAVSRRTHEIGIRLALGARPWQVRRLVVGHGLVLTAAGVGLGLAAAYASTRLLAPLLFEVSATDPATFLVVPGVLVAVALLACYGPAHRATRLDPMLALRAE